MMKRVLSLVLTAILFILGAFSASAYNSSRSGTLLHADDSGLYRISFSGKRAEIFCYPSETFNASLTLSYNITAADVFDGTVIFCCDDSDNHQMIVYVYSVDTGMLDSFAIYGGGVYDNADFCCDDESIYLIDSRSPDILRKYRFDGSLIMTYSLDGEITQVLLSFDGKVYAVVRENLYLIDSNSVTAFSGQTVYPPLFPVSAGYLASASGEIYHVCGAQVQYCFTAECDNSAKSACVIGDTLYYPNGATINGYDLNSDEKRCCYQNSFRAEALYANGDQIIVLNSAGSVAGIHKDDFTSLTESVPENVDPRVINDSPYDESARSVIFSDIYHVDHEHSQISRIPASTSLSVFRKNMNYDGYTLRLYRDDMLKTSGNIGTAWRAVFSGNGGDCSYELSVIGDLTGEGNCNSRDVNVLMDHFIEITDFNGVYTLSADMDDDGSVDAVDLALMKRFS